MSVTSETSSSETGSLPFSEQDYEELAETIHELVGEYMKDYILSMSKPDYMTGIIDDITHVIYQQLEDAGLIDSENYSSLRESVEITTNDWFAQHFYDCPDRSIPHQTTNTLVNTFGQDEEFAAKFISDKLKIIYTKDASNPAQRTPEWYLHRYNMLTASNLYKSLGSDALKNSLIYEKCKPLETGYIESKWISTEGSLHWGVKYEPLTVILYEHITRTKVGHFGCIVHSEYPFIGASPDGIVINPESPLYGRLVEIKNIYNRDMDGIPSEAYWVQMQIQMQCCDLPDCDFVETRFKEYETEQEYIDGNSSEDVINGIILHFIVNDATSNIPRYEYMPIDISLDNRIEWIENKKSELSDKYVLFKTHYWYLDEICMTTILRNDLWFQTALPRIQEIWETIQKERVSGYEHRSSKKRAPSIDLTDVAKGTITVVKEPEATCFIRLSEEDQLEE